MFIWTVRQNNNNKIQKNTFQKSYKLICILMSEITFDPLAKHDLVLGGKTLVGNHRGLDVLQILSKSLRFQGWHLATFSSLHRFYMGLRSGDWLGHSRTLMCFFLSHSFVALTVCFGLLSCWNTIHNPFSMPWPWRYMARPSSHLMQCSCPVPFTEQHAQSILFPPPCLTVGMVFLGS